MKYTDIVYRIAQGLFVLLVLSWLGAGAYMVMHSYVKIHSDVAQPTQEWASSVQATEETE